MSQFAFGHAGGSVNESGADSTNWHDLAAKVVDQLGEIDVDTAKTGVAFLYMSDAFSPAAGAILSHFQATTGIQNWVGTVGLAMIAGDSEYYENPGMAVMFCDWDANDYRLIEPANEAPVAVSDDTRTWAAEHAYNFGIVHADPRNPKVPEMIARMPEALPGAFVVGGISSSDHAYPQFANGLHSGGLSGLWLSDRVALSTGLTQGVSTLSDSLKVSESVKNVLVRIGEDKALDVFQRELGAADQQEPDWNALFQGISVGLRVSGSDTGDYLVRQVVGIDPVQGMVAIGEEVEPGQQFYICRRDDQSARDDLLRMLDEVLKRAGKTPIRGALYYSCLGRGREMFGEANTEVRLIQERFGDVPLVGFFANGEISHNRLYGFTGVLTVFT